MRSQTAQPLPTETAEKTDPNPRARLATPPHLELPTMPAQYCHEESLLAEAQRDLTAEQAADRLRKVDSVHYSERSL